LTIVSDHDRIAVGRAGAGSLADRMAADLVASNVPLERASLRRAARRAAAQEAPLAGEVLIDQVIDALIGLGPLEALLRDVTVSDVLVNGPREVYVERNGVLARSAVVFPDDAAVTAAVERVIGPLGLRLDLSSPIVDARLPDGSRLHAVIPPAAVDHPIVAVRRFVPAVDSLEALLARGTLDESQLHLLHDLVVTRTNLVVSGGTGTGKTTLLNLLAGRIPAGDRVVTIEDAAELSFRGHVVRLEGRPANSEGNGAITLTDLLRSALRLRPDRIIVGEVRGPEALDLISALNTGHAGSMSTVHANSPEEALWRLETLALSGEERVGEIAVRRQLRSALQVVVQLERRDGIRRIVSIGRVGADGVEEITC
jgi:pilus assembly protein CpaF